MSLPALALQGFATMLSLIVAIGAQNAFVLRQGLMRSHVLAVVLICAISDAVLIVAGVAGFAAVVEALPGLPQVLRYGGAAFLFAYGALRFRAAWAGGGGMQAGDAGGSLRTALLTCLAFTWANPHVWLDTFGLIGGISTSIPTDAGKAAFGAGAVTASFTFFFSLGYGARLLAPVMARPGAWRWLDAGIGAVMWGLAAGLVLGG